MFFRFQASSCSVKKRNEIILLFYKTKMIQFQSSAASWDIAKTIRIIMPISIFFFFFQILDVSNNPILLRKIIYIFDLLQNIYNFDICFYLLQHRIKVMNSFVSFVCIILSSFLKLYYSYVASQSKQKT